MILVRPAHFGNPSKDVDVAIGTSQTPHWARVSAGLTGAAVSHLGRCFSLHSPVADEALSLN